MSKPIMRIVQAQSATELEACRLLFVEYVRQERVPKACLLDFDAELAGLPGEYALPNGALLLAQVGETCAGCCALRPLHTSDYANAAEMRRLYVAKAFRGLGAGQDLCHAVLEAARVAGYSSVLLNTLDKMEAARALYESFGFYEIPPPYHDPIGGAHFLKVDLP